MDIVTDPTFWGGAGLVIASRLAMLAAVVWIARFAVRNTAHKNSPALTPRPGEPKRVPDESAAGGRPARSVRFVDLRAPQGTGRRETAPRSDAVDETNPLRNRLMEYLERGTAERTRP